jgi:hypothetical protein
MSLPSIYDLSRAFFALVEEQEALEGSTDEAAIKALWAKWEALEGALEGKVDGTLALAASVEARAKGRKEAAESLLALAKADEKLVERLEKLVIMGLDAAGRTTMDTPRFKPRIRANGGKIAVIREPASKLDDLPDDLVKTTITRSPDLDRIRDELELGADVPGFHLGARGRHLLWKAKP